MDFLLISTAVLAVIIAGLSKGGFGASAAFAATPVLAIAVGPVAAAAILLPILIVMDWFGVRSYWRACPASRLAGSYSVGLVLPG